MNIVQNIDVSLNIPSSYSPRNYNYANLTHVFSWSSSNIINVFNITTGLSSIITLPSTSSITDPSYNGILKIKNILSMDNELLWIEYISNDLTECIITYYTINQIYTQIYKTSTQSTICKSCIDANNYWICDVSSNSLYKYNYSNNLVVPIIYAISSVITNLYSILSNGITMVINYGTNNGNNILTYNIITSSESTSTMGPIIYMDSNNLWSTGNGYQTVQTPISNLSGPQIINQTQLGQLVSSNGIYVWALSSTNSNTLCMYNLTTTSTTTISLINGSITPTAVIVGANSTSNYLFLSVTNATSSGSKIYLYKISFPVYVPPVPCFLHGTKICTNTGYRRIEDLRKGDLIQTTRDGFKKIHLIGKRDIEHICTTERIKNQLYKCTNEKYPEVFEDLVMTGCHCILIDESQYEINDELKEKIKDVHTYLYVTDSRLRLPTCVDYRATVYEPKGLYTIYHLALECEDYFMNYGIYANGLLVETCSKRFLEDFKLSQLNLIE